MNILEEMYESNLFNPTTTDDMGEDFNDAMDRIVKAETALFDKYPDC